MFPHLLGDGFWASGPFRYLLTAEETGRLMIASCELAVPGPATTPLSMIESSCWSNYSDLTRPGPLKAS